MKRTSPHSYYCFIIITLTGAAFQAIVKKTSILTPYIENNYNNLTVYLGPKITRDSFHKKNGCRRNSLRSLPKSPCRCSFASQRGKTFYLLSGFHNQGILVSDSDSGSALRNRARIVDKYTRK
jgi:hypothetical protein